MPCRLDVQVFFNVFFKFLEDVKFIGYFYDKTCKYTRTSWFLKKYMDFYIMVVFVIYLLLFWHVGHILYIGIYCAYGINIYYCIL